MSDGNEERLWQINTGGDRDGVPLWPVFIILLIGAAIVGFLSFPCIKLRVNYVLHAPDDAPLNVLQMQCEGEGIGCVCRQQADNMRGGKDCEVSNDLTIRCRAVPAEEIR